MTSSAGHTVTGVGYNGLMGDTEDPFNLHRFVVAHAYPPHSWCSTYDEALLELKKGKKRTDWMWYVFPQLPLGSTATAKKFALSGLAEAQAYLQHERLGPRLHDCVDAVLAAPATDAADLMGSDTDKKKLRSSMTLFMRAEPEDPRYQAVLDKYFKGKPDSATDERLGLG